LHEAAEALKLGYVVERVAGYVYETQRCGGMPLYQLYNQFSKTHFYTMLEEEERERMKLVGYLDQTVAGYMLLPYE
jgi:hypothetical protein